MGTMRLCATKRSAASYDGRERENTLKELKDFWGRETPDALCVQ